MKKSIDEKMIVKLSLVLIAIVWSLTIQYDCANSTQMQLLQDYFWHWVAIVIMFVIAVKY